MIEDSVVLKDWQMVMPADRVNEGDVVSARLLGEDLVLWRCDGDIKVWKDLCLHRGSKLSLGEVRDGTLECPYHGWTYNGEGRCVEIPAHPEQPPPNRFTVQDYPSTVQYDWIWVCLGDPEGDPPLFEEWDDETFRIIPCGPYEFHASAPRAVENFLDVAHFPFVHEGTLGTREKTRIPEFTVDITEDGIAAEDVRVFQPDPDGMGRGDWTEYEYHTQGPFTAYFCKNMEGGKRFAIFMSVTPVDENNSRMWMQMALNYDKDVPAQQIIDFQDEVTGQDIPIVESQRPELLPLDLQAELHRPADRCSIAYRKWLNQQGLSFGTE